MDIKRVLILTGLAVVAYSMVLQWNADYGVRHPDLQAEAGIAPDVSDVPSLPKTVQPGEIPELIDATPTHDQALPVGQATVTHERFITVKTDVLDLLIDREGGDVERASLIAFPERITTPNVPFPLVDSRNNYALQSGLVGPDGTDKPVGRPVFTVDQNHYEMADAELLVDLHLMTERGVPLIKRFRFLPQDYRVSVEYIVDNNTDEPWSAAMFGQIKRDGGAPAYSDENGMGLQPYVGGATFRPGSPYSKLEFDDLEEAPYREKIEGGYIAMVQHYFLSAWIPEAGIVHTYRARKLDNQDVYLFEYTSPVQVVAPHTRGTIKSAFYIGPKDQYRLEKITPGLDLTVDYGFLWWIAQPLFDLLFLIHGFVKNWGLSIILLTLIVKTLLYPLSAASFRSMAKMRKLQPEMARLKERFGDDRQQFSQAMMELYKKEGANPLGGCFPILLQMPVFLALYWTLMESVELRQAPFMLWIHDLSDMDPYFVLPILMGISMYLTQMMQPEPPDPMQAKIFKLMPIMFTFFFLWFPSGLVLYWLVNNILSILQQWYVTRQMDKTA